MSRQEDYSMLLVDLVVNEIHRLWRRTRRGSIVPARNKWLLRTGEMLKGQRLFFSSEAPGLVFSMTYLRGKLAPSNVLHR